MRGVEAFEEDNDADDDDSGYDKTLMSSAA